MKFEHEILSELSDALDRDGTQTWEGVFAQLKAIRNNDRQICRALGVYGGSPPGCATKRILKAIYQLKADAISDE